MASSTSALRASLRNVQRSRRRLLRECLHEGALAVGSVSRVERKCGKPSCRCSRERGHAQTLYLFVGRNGRRRCKFVRRDDEDRIAGAAARYRRVRGALQALRALNLREQKLLASLVKARALSYE